MLPSTLLYVPFGKHVLHFYVNLGKELLNQKEFINIGSTDITNFSKVIALISTWHSQYVAEHRNLLKLPEWS